MFSKFIKNKVLSALVLLSSLSYGGQSQNTEPDKGAQNPQQQECKQTLSVSDKIDINGMSFYIPPEEPSREELKKKAVLMYWERLDKKTGKVIITKYPDTLKIKEEKPDATSDDSDLTLIPQPQSEKTVSAQKTQPEEIMKPLPSSTNNVIQTKQKEPDELEKILARLEAEEREAQQQKNCPTNRPVATEQTNTGVAVNTIPSVKKSVKEPDLSQATDLNQLLDLLEAANKAENPTNTTPAHPENVVSQPALTPHKDTPITSETDLFNQTNSLPKNYHSCKQNVREVEELLALIEETNEKKSTQTNKTETVQIPALKDTDTSTSSNHIQADLKELLDALDRTEGKEVVKQNDKNTTEEILSDLKDGRASTKPHSIQADIQELLDLQAKDNISSPTNLMTQSQKTETPEIQKTETNTVQIVSHQPEIPPVVIHQTAKNSLDAIHELLEECEKEQTGRQQSSNETSDFSTTGGIILSLLGGSAFLGMSLRRRKKAPISKDTQPDVASNLPVSKEKIEKIPEPTKVEETSISDTTESDSLQNTSEPEKNQIDLIPSTEIAKECTEKRNELANKLKAARTIEEIKNKRKLLSKQLRLARTNNDEQTIQKILETRKELTQKRRKACLCITDPYTARIKEERRLLTKKMTIARKHKDLQTMSQITQQRERLKEEVKSLNAYVREFNYTQNRVHFLKEKTVQLILSHQRS